jgi:hypothetical protein
MACKPQLLFQFSHKLVPVIVQVYRIRKEFGSVEGVVPEELFPGIADVDQVAFIFFGQSRKDVIRHVSHQELAPV